jgi:hypothetical protein
MKLAPVGRAPDPADLDLEPVVVPVIAYKEDHSEVVHEFPFRPVMPPGAMAAMVRNSGPNGELPANIVQAILDRCVDPDARDRWHEFLDSEELSIFQETLGDVLNALTEVYAKRPTRQRSGSLGTGSLVAPTLTVEPPSPE